MNPESARELRLAASLSGVIALRMLGLFLILPVFMVLARDVPGFTPLLGGLTLGAYGLTQALMQQPFGWLSDRWGRRPVLLAGLVLFAAGGVVAAAADSMSGLLAGRALQGCGAIAGVAMALVADTTRPERRPISMAIIGIGIGAAFLLSLGISVPLANLVGLAGLFWLTVGFSAVGVVLVVSAPRAGRPAHAALDALPVQMGPIRLLAISAFLLHAVMTALFVVLPGRLVTQHGLVLAEHWRLYVPAMAVSVLVSLPLLTWVGRRGAERTALPWSFAVAGSALYLLSRDTQAGWLPGTLALYFSGFNVLEAAMPALVARLAGGSGRGRRLGLYSTFQFLGAFVGGAGGGAMLGVWGGSATLGMAGGACIVWSLVLARMLLSARQFPTGRPK